MTKEEIKKGLEYTARVTGNSVFVKALKTITEQEEEIAELKAAKKVGVNRKECEQMFRVWMRTKYKNAIWLEFLSCMRCKDRWRWRKMNETFVELPRKGIEELDTIKDGMIFILYKMCLEQKLVQRVFLEYKSKINEWFKNYLKNKELQEKG